jgi:flavin reductase (DIM6/NTAB) family NADH-FMN oxidoreductase RutF
MSGNGANVNPDDFKGALGSWAAGVTVVTTRDADQVYGLTVSSFSSLSIDPLLVLVCIQNSNVLADMAQRAGKFGVSILAQGQEDISTYFAKSGREPVASYSEFAMEERKTGSPLVAGAIAQLDCELHQALPGGDHSILVGRVVDVVFDPDKEPLIYYRRGYRKLTD